MELWIVRHGETVDNFNHVVQGQQPGKLSELGIAQARQTGVELAKQRFSEVYCSDLNRTKETLGHILESFPDAKSLKINYSPFIRERCFGVLEGLKSEVYQETVKNSGIPKREYKPKDGESWQEVQQRAIEFLGLLKHRFIWPEKSESKDLDVAIGLQNLHIKEPMKEIQEERKEGSITGTSTLHPKENEEKSELSKVLVISHKGFLTELLNVINYIISKDNSVAVEGLGNCSIHALKVTAVEGAEKSMKNAKYEFLRKNDISHLNPK